SGKTMTTATLRWVGWITAMFLHAGWDHILGNMLFLDLRQERRGCVRAAPLSGLLLSRRIRRGDDADRDDPALRLRLRRTDTHLGRQRRDRRRSGRLLRALSRLTHKQAGAVVPRD